MKIIGCDLYASQQSIAMLDRDTGEIVEKTLTHEGAGVPVLALVLVRE